MPMSALSQPMFLGFSTLAGLDMGLKPWQSTSGKK
ncbi:hypothetical protein OESDEN_15278 [Oesophagostomum dentatum]|uniref:Uncharacterized protein n=1 Tax=Oesophagostomum dentatum TaxID=61180 RepID=A0A0B1SM90_OESDE|nr:hypothetical protein OESDEN_15278 [Oesophagostomum dentatum]